jgi:small subunit ribosomal protein S17
MPKAVKVGVVTKNKMDKTVVVAVQRLVRHPLYKRAFKKTSTFMAHDEDNRCQVGDRVRIIESRPISSRKRWRVIEVVTSQARLEGKPAGESAAQDQRDESKQVGA